MCLTACTAPSHLQEFEETMVNTAFIQKVSALLALPLLCVETRSAWVHEIGVSRTYTGGNFWP